VATRVTQENVRALTGFPTTIDAAAVTEAANVFVDANLLAKGLTEPVLRQIELFLASHFLVLTVEKGSLAAETLGEGTDRLHDTYAAGLKSTRFGQQAILLDTTGTLALLTDRAENPNRRSALFTVVGTPSTLPPEEDL